MNGDQANEIVSRDVLQPQEFLEQIRPLAMEIDKQIAAARATTISIVEKYWAIGKILHDNRQCETYTQVEIAKAIGWKQQRVSDAIRIYEFAPQGLTEEDKQISIRKLTRIALPTRTRNVTPRRSEKEESGKVSNIGELAHAFPELFTVIVSLEEREYNLLKQVAEREQISQDDWLRNLAVEELNKFAAANLI